MKENKDIRALTLEERMKIKTYPMHWQATLKKNMEKGDSMEEILKDLKEIEEYL